MKNSDYIYNIRLNIKYNNIIRLTYNSLTAASFC